MSDAPADAVELAVFEILKRRLDQPAMTLSSRLVDLEWETCSSIVGDVMDIVAEEPDALERLIAGPMPIMDDREAWTAAALVKHFADWIKSAKSQSRT